MNLSFDDLTHGPDGLVPTIVQDAIDGTVLMLGYMNREAFDLTIETESVTFWSRSRGEIWTKGVTSGNTLALVAIAADCDADTLLVQALPRGPTCHTGQRSCFDIDRQSLGAIVDALTAIVDERRGADATTSYTAQLIADPDLAARKVLEEAGEVAFAAKDLVGGSDAADHVAEEAADVIYHLLALLAAVEIESDTVAGVLASRRR